MHTSPAELYRTLPERRVRVRVCGFSSLCGFYSAKLIILIKKTIVKIKIENRVKIQAFHVLTE